MYHKGLRFHKPLPRINMQGTRQPGQETNGNTAEGSPFRTTSSNRELDIADLFDFMKKMKGPGQDYELEPRDRNVLIELPEIDEKDEDFFYAVKTWISEVCTKVVSSAFNLLLSDKLSGDQAKVSCSEGILRNIVLLVQKYPHLTTSHIKEINTHIEKDVIPYLKRKYPMTESSDVNKSLDESVNPTDKTDAL